MVEVAMFDLVQHFFLLWPPNSSSVVGNTSLFSHRFCGARAQAWLRWVLRVKVEKFTKLMKLESS